MTALILNSFEDVRNSFEISKLFQTSPVIYSLIIFLTLITLFIWLHGILTLRLSLMMPVEFIDQISALILKKNYKEMTEICQENHNFASLMLLSGMEARKLGMKSMIEAVKTEGKLLGNSIWRRITMLNEIAVIAPALGFLGSMLNFFFIFYETDPSSEASSFTEILSIILGPTLLGLVISLLSVIFYSTLKLKTSHLLKIIEEEAVLLMSKVEPT